MPSKGRSVDPTVDTWACGHHGGHTKAGDLCRQPVVAGTNRCKNHAGISLAKAKAKGAVVVEIKKWGLGDTTLDPGEVLLRLVTQSAARCDFYAALLSEAYEAAERLKAAHQAEQLVLADQSDDVPAGEAAKRAARVDLERIFTTGGVAALVGHQYGTTRDGDIYATGEAIRGLAQLEAAERDRCANFAAKAIAAGIAERQVRIAERQVDLVATALNRALAEIGLSPEKQREAARRVAGHLRLAAG